MSGKSWFGVHPLASLMVTEKGSVYICGGICYDLKMGRVVFTPGFAPGFYFKNKGKSLHFPLEFRSSVALSVELWGYHRLGVQFYHISNGSLGRKNPGEESLVAFYSIAVW